MSEEDFVDPATIKISKFEQEEFEKSNFKYKKQVADVKRECLQCDKKFMAINKFIRLCDDCRRNESMRLDPRGMKT